LEIPAGASSERKMAEPNPKGTEIRRARIEVTTVPYTNGKAPNCSVTGFQVLVKRKAKPNLWRVGADWVHN